MKYDHPILTNIQELHSDLFQDKQGIVFVWVPGHLGVRGNSAADVAAHEALDELIPFSDLKPGINQCIMELWKHKGGEYPDNQLGQM